jgi:hypothetical protein
MLQVNPSFCELGNEDAAFVLACIDELAKVFSANGFVPEDDFLRILRRQDVDDINVDNCPTKTGVPLNAMAMSRQRAAEMNHQTALSIFGPGGDRSAFGNRKRKGGEGDVTTATSSSSSSSRSSSGGGGGGGGPPPPKKRRKNKNKCGMSGLLGCPSTVLDPDSDGWKRCCPISQRTKKSCKMIFCLAPTCVKMYNEHRKACVLKNKG